MIIDRLWVDKGYFHGYIKNVHRENTPNDLTSHQLWRLRQSVPLNSIYISDYENEYVPAENCYDFFEGYNDYLYSNVMVDGSYNSDEEVESAMTELDNESSLWDYFNGIEDPFNLGSGLLDGDYVLLTSIPDYILNGYKSLLAPDYAAEIDPNKFYAIYHKEDGYWSIMYQSGNFIDPDYHDGTVLNGVRTNTIKELQTEGETATLGESKKEIKKFKTKVDAINEAAKGCYIEYGNDPKDVMKTKKMSHEKAKKLIDDYKENYNFADIICDSDVEESLHISQPDGKIWKTVKSALYWTKNKDLEDQADNVIDNLHRIADKKESIDESIINEDFPEDYVRGELEWNFEESPADYYDTLGFENEEGPYDFWVNFLNENERKAIIKYISDAINNNDYIWEVIFDSYRDIRDDCPLLNDKIKEYKEQNITSLGESVIINESSSVIWGIGNAREYLSKLTNDDLKKELIKVGYSEEDLAGKTRDEIIKLVSSDQYVDEIDEDTFYDTIVPMINKQTYKGIVLMSGTVSRWDGELEGGKAVESHELYDGDWDINKMEIVEDDLGTLVWKGYHHDGTHIMHLYAVPKDDEGLRKFITDLGLDEVEIKWYGYNKEDAVDMAIEDLSVTFLNDAIDDWSKVKELCKPLKNGLRANVE